MTRRCLLAAVAVVVSSNCDASTSSARSSTFTTYAHGVKTGDVVTLDGICGRRGEQERGARELVTFLSPGDCSTCDVHLSGLGHVADSIVKDSVRWVVVGYGPPSRVTSLVRRTWPRARPLLCVDSIGDAWADLAVEHTPVTMLLANRRVAVLHDWPLATEGQRRSFVTAIRGASMRNRY